MQETALFRFSHRLYVQMMTHFLKKIDVKYERLKTKIMDYAKELAARSDGKFSESRWIRVCLEGVMDWKGDGYMERESGGRGRISGGGMEGGGYLEGLWKRKDIWKGRISGGVMEGEGYMERKDIWRGDGRGRIYGGEGYLEGKHIWRGDGREG